MKFKNPIHIIQIFDNSYEYGKDEKSYSKRKSKYIWKENIVSKSGIIRNGVLIINKETFKILQLNEFKIILLVDYNTDSEIETLERFNYLNIFDYLDYHNKNDFEKHKLLRNHINRINYVFSGNFIRPLYWDCFVFRKNNNISVEFIWDYSKIGMPKRENFKICDLEKNKAIEININGKKDEHKRIYIEKNIIIEYLGEINEYELITNPNYYFTKEIPKNRKQIKLLKKMY